MHKVAVYGSLRKGMYNHALLKKANYLGRYDTKPVYSMYAVSSYPGVKPKGNTSIVMEVYEVDDELLEEVNLLEGYDPKSKINDFYNRVTVNTPFGLAYTFLYQPGVDKGSLVDHGDWVEFIKTEVELRKLLDHAQIF